MTLKSCPECSHNVSSAASACPSCGFPLKEDPFIEYTQRRLEFRKSGSRSHRCHPTIRVAGVQQQIP